MLIRLIMASLFTVVFITACVIGVGLLLGEGASQLVMVLTLLVSGVVGWLVAVKLFRVPMRRW